MDCTHDLAVPLTLCVSALVYLIWKKDAMFISVPSTPAKMSRYCVCIVHRSVDWEIDSAAVRQNQEISKSKMRAREGDE